MVADGTRAVSPEPPGDQVEALITLLWSKVLESPDVGVNDDFIEIGGDSVRMVELVSEMEREFDIELDVFDVVNATTVRQQAQLIRKATA